MKKLPAIRWFLAGTFMGVMVASSVGAAETSIRTALFSQTYNGYKREKNPDGSYKPETYVLGNGGVLPGTTRDNTQEKVPFKTIAKVLDQLLSRQNYRFADDTKSAELLLVVQWGQTLAYNTANYSNRVGELSQAIGAMANHLNNKIQGDEGRRLDSQLMMMKMENTLRDLQNEKTANLLGYQQDLGEANDFRRYLLMTNKFDDLREDIEEERYYISITAYDFRLAREKHQQKLLWITRVSIRSPGNGFEERLPEMIASASRYAGRDTKHLVRGFEGLVTLGELKVVGVVEEPATSKTPAKPGEQK